MLIVKFTLFPFVVFAVKSASIEPRGREVLKLLTVTVAEEEAGRADINICLQLNSQIIG